jgi:hypothetical protein
MICPFFKRKILMPNLNRQSDAPERATWHTASPVVKTGRLLKLSSELLNPMKFAKLDGSQRRPSTPACQK